MSIARVSDTIVENLPKLLLEASKFNSKDNTLETEDFEGDRNFRSYIDKFLPVMVIIDYDDIQNELSGYNLEPATMQKIMSQFKQAMKKQQGLVKSIQYQELSTLMVNITTDTQLQPTQKVLKIRGLFSKGYVIQDQEQVRPNQLIFIVHNFQAVRTRINNYVDKELKAVGIDTKIGQYLDAGHSSLKYGENYAFNQPKQTAMLFDINTTSASQFISKSINLNTATSIYVKRTEQLEQSVEVTKDFGDKVASIFVEFGGSIVVYENQVANQERGRLLERAEKFGTNKQVMSKIAAHFNTIKETAIKGQYDTVKLGRIIRNIYKYASSPSALDIVIHNIQSTITGKKTTQFRQTQKISKKTTTVKTKKVVVPQLKVLGTKTTSNQTTYTLNLTNLQNLLNARLHDQIRANMGTGSSKNILNYRQGRLAQSAKVERLSESRQGMITAFYTYMKYPYATFSDGGRQQYPKSRDPKLLIAKSIREIAGTTVANRMRAVNI